MATVRTNDSIVITKYNNLDRVDISIRDLRNDDDILLLEKDLIFLFSLLKEWFDGINYISNSYRSTYYDKR